MITSLSGLGVRFQGGEYFSHFWTELGVLQDKAFQNVVHEPLHQNLLAACIFASPPCDSEGVGLKFTVCETLFWEMGDLSRTRI